MPLGWRTEVTRYGFVRDRVPGLPNLYLLVVSVCCGELTFARKARIAMLVSLGIRTLFSQSSLLVFTVTITDHHIFFLSNTFGKSVKRI